MSPRRSVAATRDTHEAIVRRAMHVASVAGLEGVTIGRLADDLGMSKAGVAGHFANKEQLQLEAIGAAVALFTARVADATRSARPGAERLLAGLDAWFSYLERSPFPGGCVIEAAVAEQDGRPGPVRDAVAEAVGRWRAFLRGELERALEAGEIAPALEAEPLAFALQALGAGLNQAVQLRGDADAGRHARVAAHALLGTSASPPPA